MRAAPWLTGLRCSVPPGRDPRLRSGRPISPAVLRPSSGTPRTSEGDVVGTNGQRCHARPRTSACMPISPSPYLLDVPPLFRHFQSSAYGHLSLRPNSPHLDPRSPYITFRSSRSGQDGGVRAVAGGGIRSPFRRLCRARRMSEGEHSRPTKSGSSSLQTCRSASTTLRRTATAAVPGRDLAVTEVRLSRARWSLSTPGHGAG